MSSMIEGSISFESVSETGKLDIEHVRTEEQIADILRKPMAREQFCELHEKLGVVRISDKL
jgi:hypothetical protein